MRVQFTVNGRAQSLDTEADRRVVDLLRGDLGLTGTKESCGSGECGACSILVDGESRLSCLMLAAQLEGRQITTIEGIAADPARAGLLRAFVEHGAVQCGYCSPGMIVSAVDLLRRQSRPERGDVRLALSGNLCRCTGYQKIIDAVVAAGGTDWTASAGVPTLLHESVGQRKPLEKLPSPPAGLSRNTQVLLPGTGQELLKLAGTVDSGQLLAGGTDLLVLRREGRATTRVLIGLERVPELRTISVEENEIAIGATATFERIAGHPTVRRHLRVLAQAIDVLGSPPIRHMATLGGNLCTASPAADSLPALYVLGAEVELRSLHHRRRVCLGEFIKGPRQNSLQPGEVLWSVRIPLPKEGTFSVYHKVGRRKAQAIAVASLAAAWSLKLDGTIHQIRLAWGSVGPTVLVLPQIEHELESERLSANLLKRLAPQVAALVRPIDDIRASAWYRRQFAGNLLLKLTQD